MNRFLTLSLTAVSVIAAQNLHASPSGSYVQNNSGGVQPVSSTDLVNQGQPTLLSKSASNYTAYQTASTDVLNDGNGGGFNTVAGDTAVTTQTTPWSITYQLNTASAPNGYDITKIDVLSLWTDDFVNQNYDIAFATTTNPAFVSIGSFTATTNHSTGGTSILSTVVDTTGVLQSNVTGIQFTFSTIADFGNNQHHGAYKELDVTGAASLPEPGTLAFFAGGSALLFVRRRRSA